jgi:uncharacterized membrane protein
MIRYFSSKNIISVSILWILVFMMSILLFVGIQNKAVSLAPIVLLSLVILTILWILFDTRYVIKKAHLFYRSGPFRGWISINEITQIKTFSGFSIPVTMKPSLDYNGFIIKYSNNFEVYVSPKTPSQFINDLKKINPSIQID